MPIYEYECPNCGVLEVIQKASDPVLKECPACEERGKKSPVTKIVSASSFHLKGTGWYKTDYTSNSTSGAAKNASNSAGETETKNAENTPTTTETKTPEPKKEEKKVPSTSDGNTK
jgi:putative FmdB family regulatory protein